MTKINLTDVTGAKSVETCIAEAYASFGVPALGGASDDGWSKLSDFQRCPYRYYLMHAREKSDEKAVAAPALELGSLVHAMLACHYVRAIKPEYPTPYALNARVEELEANPEIVAEAMRLYQAYFNHYGNIEDERIEVLGVEIPAGIVGTHTCRLDTLIRKQHGVWIREHKTASRESRDVLEGWWLDGEILGEVYGYKLSKLDEVFGPLVGVEVNIIIKTQVPKFRRVDVVITDELLEQYKRDSAVWRGMRNDMQTVGYWPRKLQGCIGRYGTCEFWDHCRDANSTDDFRLNQLLSQSLKGE